MNTAILLCAAMLAADDPVQVQAQVLYGTDAKDEQRADIELWISKAVEKSGSPLALPRTGWMVLTDESQHLLTGNGFYIDGKVTEKDSKYEVEIEGCDGFSLDKNVTLRPGERRVVKLTENPAPDNTFIALEAAVSEQAKKRAEAMIDNAKTFRLELNYDGDQDKPFYRMLVSVPVVNRRRNSPFNRIVQVKEGDAVRIIDHLARDGFFDRAHISGKLEKLPQPCYLLSVHAGDLDLTEIMGWGLPMIHRLDALREVLPDNGKKDMDLLLGRLSGFRRQWEAEAIQNQKTSFKGWELYIWQEDDQTLFSLMVGTNRLKSDDEIAKSAVEGFDSIKPKIDQLKQGEFVTLHGRRLGEQAPAALAKAATNYCEEIGLKTQ